LLIQALVGYDRVSAKIGGPDMIPDLAYTSQGAAASTGVYVYASVPNMVPTDALLTISYWNLITCS